MSKIIGFILIFLGIGLIAYSMTLEGFTNEKEFTDKMYLFHEDEDRSEKYFKLRESYLTSKYYFQDYGATSLTLGLIFLILIPVRWKNFKTPDNKTKIRLLGFVSAFISVIAYVVDLFIDASRWAFPPWADSLGIPLMGVPLLLIMALVWCAINLIGLKEPFRTSVSITEFRLQITNYWFLSLIIITSIITVLLIYEGSFSLILAGVLWIYFYLSMYLGRLREVNS